MVALRNVRGPLTAESLKQAFAIRESTGVWPAMQLKPRTKGIYFLRKEGELVYIGKSVDLLWRMCVHADEAKGDFTEACWLDVPPPLCTDENLLAIEAALIDYFRPPENKQLDLKHLRRCGNQYAIVTAVLGIPISTRDLLLNIGPMPRPLQQGAIAEAAADDDMELEIRLARRQFKRGGTVQ